MSAGYAVKNGTAGVSLATGAKTQVNLISGANDAPLVTELGASFDGVTASATPAAVDLGFSTQATAGTPGSSPTPTLIRGKGSAGSTSGVAYSAEPTALTSFKMWFVTPNGGLLVIQFPLGREPVPDLSGGTNKGIYLRVNTSATVNCLAYMEFEE
jgi:hypothetical protein